MPADAGGVAFFAPAFLRFTVFRARPFARLFVCLARAFVRFPGALAAFVRFALTFTSMLTL